MTNEDIRIEILKILIPAASRIGLTEPEKLIEKAKAFEAYVMSEPEEIPVCPRPPEMSILKKRGRPPKIKNVDANVNNAIV